MCAREGERQHDYKIRFQCVCVGVGMCSAYVSAWF